MWASYLVITGMMLLVALAIYLGKKWWFVRPIERHLSEVMLDDTTPLDRQRQSTENQAEVQRELMKRDMSTIRHEWEQIERILQVIRSVLS